MKSFRSIATRWRASVSRAVMDASALLALLLQRQGRNAEAHDTLVGLVAWFSEGAATTDLRHARTVLAGLA